MTVLYLIMGFVLLIKGADFFVSGSSSLARRLRIPSAIIGLTIVALGTSAPEAAVSIAASLQGNSDICYSNIIGSNFFNLFAILGVCALITTLYPDKKIITRDFPISILTVGLLIIFSLSGSIVFIQGLSLLAVFFIYIYILILDAMKYRKTEKAEQSRRNENIIKSIIFIILGLAGVIIGGELAVNKAVLIAETLGVSKTLIGLTIVSVGTSLPELVTSVVAIKKRDTGLAIGNLIGSNSLNILFILGTSSVVKVVTVSGESLLDAMVLCIATLLLFIIIYFKKKVTRFTGFCCLSFYILFLLNAILR